MLVFIFLRRQRPPRSTRTATPFPYTTLVRSIGVVGGTYGGGLGIGLGTSFGLGKGKSRDITVTTLAVQLKRASDEAVIWEGRAIGRTESDAAPADEIGRLADALFRDFPGPSGQTVEVKRSEGRRVGKEGVSTGNSRWSPVQSTKKTD